MFAIGVSLLVVGSHVGGMGDRPAGTTAIAGFFTISGFVMARTILENYSDGARRADPVPLVHSHANAFMAMDRSSRVPLSRPRRDVALPRRME